MHSLFLYDRDHLPENVDDDYIVSALEHLEEEGSPEEVAENHKNLGNACFRSAAYRWDEAIHHYSIAISQQTSNLRANSIYFSNRAAVQLAKGNYGKAIRDCVEALKLDETNIKASWRAAKASNELGRYKEALEFSTNGLLHDPQNKSLLAEQERASKCLSRKNLDLRQLQERLEDSVEKNRVLLVALGQRSISVSPQAQFDTKGQYENSARIDERGVLHLSVMFLYEEHHQSDFVKDFEEYHTFADHLSYMFPTISKSSTFENTDENNEMTFAPWDIERKYTLERIEIYFEEWGGENTVNYNALNSYSNRKKRWISVPLTATLIETLKRPEYVMHGFPVFYVVSSNSKFRDQFLKQESEA